MEIYFDESGNTGSVRENNNRLNYDNQRHFALCGIIFENEDDKEIMKAKYIALKKDFNIDGELKGNSLLTRKNNELLLRFIDEILDSAHFKINIYDKNFYLLTKMVGFLSGFDFKHKFPLFFYQLVSTLITENEDILIKYCQLEENITLENLKVFLEYLGNYSYKDPNNLFLSNMANSILEHELEDITLYDLMEMSKYGGTSSTNIVNLSTLSEFIFMLKYESGTRLTNESLNIYHDEIDGFSNVFQNELAAFGVKVNFISSDDNIFIQIADNVASIFFKVINQMVNIFENKKEWDNNSAWTLELTSKLLNKIHTDNLKFTLPIQNWCIALCVKDMFTPSFRIENRNNHYFNNYYIANMFKLNDEIERNLHIDFSEILETLER